MHQTATTLGLEFARALAAKEYDRLTELLHPELDFRGVTPRKSWEASDPAGFVDDVAQQWFGEAEIEGIEHLETDAFADRERVTYRFRTHKPDGTYVVEQTAYLGERDGRIGFMRIACSGYRPV
jgi:hypothetical protein